MIAYWVVFAITVVGAVGLNARQATADDARNPQVLALAALTILMLSVFAGARSPTSDGDYLNYLDWINTLAQTRTWAGLVEKDPLFGILAWLLRTGHGRLTFLMGVGAALSLFAKLRILRSPLYRGLLGFGLLFLVARFFLLHEFTQIRAVLGISIATLALVYSVEGQRLKGIVTFGVGMAFHISVVALVPLFLVSDRTPVRLKAAIVGGVAFVMLAASVSVDPAILSDLILRMIPYLTGQYSTNENTLASAYFIVKAVVLVLLWVQWRSLSSGMRLAVIGCTYGMAMTIVFIDVDILSLRLAELVSIFDCLCFAWLFRWAYDREPITATIMAVGLAGAFFASTLSIVQAYEVIR